MSRPTAHIILMIRIKKPLDKETEYYRNGDSRRILHCTKTGLVWECRSKKLTERQISRRHVAPFTEISWNRMLQAYTNSSLTRHSDRLIAIKGMINTMENNRDDRNCFGVWTAELPTSLSWSVSRYHAISPGSSIIPADMKGMEDVPSWSWASKDGKATMGMDYMLPASSEKASRIRQDANMLCAEILFSDSDRRPTINGALLPCSISDEVGFDSKEANNLEKHLCPEAELAHHAAGTAQAIRGFQCGSQGPNFVGLSIMDDESHTKERDKQYFCAYLSVRDRISE